MSFSQREIRDWFDNPITRQFAKELASDNAKLVLANIPFDIQPHVLQHMIFCAKGTQGLIDKLQNFDACLKTFKSVEVTKE